jgi:hypothetical protein
MASKLRRPPTTPKTVMATPKKKTGGKGAQQAVIDNFDLEGEFVFVAVVCIDGIGVGVGRGWRLGWV